MAETTQAQDIGTAGTVLRSIADSVKAANDIIKGVSDLLPDLTRTIVVEVDNITSRTLTLTGNTQFVSGGFGPTLPQGQILPSKSDVFSFQGGGLPRPTGVNGMVTYSLQGVGEFSVAADNPLAGTNSVNVFSNPSVDSFVSIIGVHSDGNHNHARFAVIEKSLIEKGVPPRRRGSLADGNFIQSSFGRQGNFELLVPQGNVVRHWFRDNDAPGVPWHLVRDQELRYPPGATVKSVHLIQSNFLGDGTNGNFEVVTRVALPGATDGDHIDFSFINSKEGKWNGPFGLSADGQLIVGATGL